MAKRQDWEKIEALGGGGQSEVFLVRNPARVAERKKQLDKVMKLAGQAFNNLTAREFTEAIMGYGRKERVSELGVLKIYKPRAAGARASQQELKRLRIEIEVLGQSRRGLPKLLDSNESERWIVTEYFPKGTLENHLLEYKGDVLLSLTVFHSLVETVAGLHKDNIFHRDIKPANVFIGDDGRLILGDFGIAFLPKLPKRVTFTNERVGPRDYMPPWAEREERLEKISGNFDVYMLGKLLWCMVGGRLKLIREWHRKPEFDLTRQFPRNPQMDAINTILDKCLHDNPADCLPRADELLLVVDEHLSVMRRSGQMLAAHVPRPCRVCGKGFYERVGNESGSPMHPYVSVLPSGMDSGPYERQGWTQSGVLFVEPFACDYCGNVQLFSKTRTIHWMPIGGFD